MRNVRLASKVFCTVAVGALLHSASLATALVRNARRCRISRNCVTERDWREAPARTRNGIGPGTVQSRVVQRSCCAAGHIGKRIVQRRSAVIDQHRAFV